MILLSFFILIVNMLIPNSNAQKDQKKNEFHRTNFCDWAKLRNLHYRFGAEVTKKTRLHVKVVLKNIQESLTLSSD